VHFRRSRRAEALPGPSPRDAIRSCLFFDSKQTTKHLLDNVHILTDICSRFLDRFHKSDVFVRVDRALNAVGIRDFYELLIQRIERISDFLRENPRSTSCC